MLHGDISNEPAPKVGFRFEEIIKREEDGRLNRSGKAMVARVDALDLEAVLFTTGDERKAAAYCYKWGVKCGKIYSVDSVLDLVQLVREHNLIAYYDTDADILSMIKQRAPKGLEVHKWTLQDNLYLES